MGLVKALQSLAVAGIVLVAGAGVAMAAEVPAPGQSPRIDAIKERGSLRAGILGGYPWLQENTTAGC